MRRRSWVARFAAATVLIGAVAAVVIIAALFAARGRDDFRAVPVTQLTDSLHSKGIAVCSSTGPDSGRKGEPISTQVLHLALPADCADPIDLQIDKFTNAAHRDAAARNAEAQDRQRHFGVVFTWHRYTLYLQSDDANTKTSLRDRVIDALDAAGAR
jgi:hypothetical protein